MTTKPLKIAGVGCGERTWIYMQLIAEQPSLFQIVAAADPVPEYRQRIEQLTSHPGFQSFSDADSFFDKGKIADVVIIGTQDNYHYGPCRRALEMGYDVVLEKPIAQRVEEVIELEQLARKLNRRVMICHVYRFNPMFNTIKNLLTSGTIGDIVSMNAVEGVKPWHFAHSFVRGHWSVAAKSNPIIMAKCCHDLDLLSWMIGDDCLTVSSFGHLSHFSSHHAQTPPNKTCPSLLSGEITTPYCALRYTTDKKEPWLAQIYPQAATASDEEIIEWLKSSPWGRDVYQCDNDVPDHQTLNLQFANNVTCTFTMTAFETGRHWDIYGTKGTLKVHDMHDDNHDLKIVVKKHHSNHETVYPVVTPQGGYRFHHEGGDEGLVQALYEDMTCSPQDGRSSITKSLQSHLMAFAAEKSRLHGGIIHLADLLKKPHTAPANV